MTAEGLVPWAMTCRPRKLSSFMESLYQSVFGLTEHAPDCLPERVHALQGVERSERGFRPGGSRRPALREGPG